MKSISIVGIYGPIEENVNVDLNFLNFVAILVDFQYYFILVSGVCVVVRPKCPSVDD